LDLVFFLGLGFAFMSTSIACSKLNLKSDTGLAFGVGRSSLCISPEHTSAAACSAFCNDIRKDVRILPVIVAVRKLRKVQWQIFLADRMERADHATQILAPRSVPFANLAISDPEGSGRGQWTLNAEKMMLGTTGSPSGFFTIKPRPGADPE